VELLIFWKERLVVIANTKTGSTSLESAFEGLAEVVVSRPAALKHTTAAACRRHVAPWLAEFAGGAPFETAALVREPLDWLGSWFRDRAGSGELPEGMDFAGFGRDVLAAPPPGHARIITQAEMLCAEDGTPAVDALFRYDAIERFVEFLEDRLGCEITLPRLRVSPAAPTDLPADLRARLAEHLAADIALYDAARG
jgi:hypothetical protein